MSAPDRPLSAAPADPSRQERGDPAQYTSPGQPLISFILRPFWLPLLLLLGVGVSVLVAVDRNARSAALVSEAQARLTLITMLLRDTADLERGQRGYVITGMQSFLQPYTNTKKIFPGHIEALRKSSVTDQQRVDLNRVALLIGAWDRQAALPEIAARRESLDAAVKLVSDGSGKRTLDEARQTLNAMQSRENARLNAALLSSTATLRNVRAVTLLGLLLSVLLLILTAIRAARTVAGNVQDVTARARQMAAGDYDDRLPPTPLLELRELGQQFQIMAGAVKEREQALRTTNTALERSNRELEQFAYVASHDLQEPLRTIGSYTELLSKRYTGQLDERADQYIAFTISATQRLKYLIQDLLAYSRVRQSGRNFSAVNTAEIVAQVLDDLQLQIQGAEVRVESMPVVWGNPELLRHVFLNLIGNALKFRAEGRPAHVSVSAQDDGTHWTVCVHDNGIGIEPQYHDRIFGVFQRLHGPSEYEGSGIGLAVTRTAVEQHGGTLSLNSVLGQGSVFSFTVPHAPASLGRSSNPLLPAGAEGKLEPDPPSTAPF
ncbi:HAMP domain-containing protein [Deinococcus sp. Arct2-2]|uniref:sensor histidine kinase n=1 Tax=Deinococcus sp. Arct2-2 TaxID=2568653 RepID=UPI0010A37693|nr:sensor histidine kinase [Deinococcus sp. Arct2-2]THF70263.1 HAMP domain-containing protein [Deinococcus sp. Arct2-2]